LIEGEVKMKITKNIGDLLLVVFLLLAGLAAFGVTFPFGDVISGIAALGAAVFKLVGK
jgi:hypothetical protein